MNFARFSRDARTHESGVLYRLELRSDVCFLQLTGDSNNLLYRFEVLADRSRVSARFGGIEMQRNIKFKTKKRTP